MQEIPPVNRFLINKYLSISDIFSNYISVIFNITYQLNLGELK